MEKLRVIKEDKKIKRHCACGKTQCCDNMVSLQMDVQSNVKQNLNRNLWKTGPNDSEAHLEK